MANNKYMYARDSHTVLECKNEAKNYFRRGIVRIIWFYNHRILIGNEETNGEYYIS